MNDEPKDNLGDGTIFSFCVFFFFFVFVWSSKSRTHLSKVCLCAHPVLKGPASDYNKERKTSKEIINVFWISIGHSIVLHRSATFDNKEMWFAGRQWGRTYGGCPATGSLKVAGSDPQPWLAKCCVPEQDAKLTLTAPDAGVWMCVCVCVCDLYKIYINAIHWFDLFKAAFFFSTLFFFSSMFLSQRCSVAKGS